MSCPHCVNVEADSSVSIDHYQHGANKTTPVICHISCSEQLIRSELHQVTHPAHPWEGSKAILEKHELETLVEHWKDHYFIVLQIG